MATIVYNGFTKLNKIKIDSFRTAAILARDGLSVQTHEHRISGTGLISGTSPADFENTLALARGELCRPRGALTIDLGNQRHFNISDPDEYGGPMVNFTIEQISTVHAIVTFDIRFWYTEPLPADTFQGDVLSHQWVQTWDFGPDMMMMHHIAGSIRVRFNAVATPAGESASATDYAVGRNPDAYRGLVVPPIPPGCRRERTRFGEDDTGNECIYTVEDREYAWDIPKPALTGDGRFEWTQDLFGSAFLGMKMFEIELAAPTEVCAIDLLAAAVECSKRRITYSGPNSDLVFSVTVEEPNMLTQNRVRYRVVAQCSTKGQGTAPGAIAPPNFKLFSNLLAAIPAGPGGVPPAQAALTGYEDPPQVGVYGTGGRLARSLRRALYISVGTGSVPPVPRAQFQSSGGVATTFPNVIPTVTYISPVAIREFIHPEGCVTVPTKPPGTETPASTTETQNSWIESKASDRVIVQDTGVKWMRSHRLDGADVPLQLYKPKVLLVSEFTGARLNQPVSRPLRAAHPSGSVVLMDEFTPTTGAVDGNGNRVFSARHVRVLELGHKLASSYASGTNPGWNQPTAGSTLTFWPGQVSGTGGSIRMAIDPSIGNQGGAGNIGLEGTMFALATETPTDDPRKYPVGPPEQYVT